MILYDTKRKSALKLLLFAHYAFIFARDFLLLLILLLLILIYVCVRGKIFGFGTNAPFRFAGRPPSPRGAIFEAGNEGLF